MKVIYYAHEVEYILSDQIHEFKGVETENLHKYVADPFERYLRFTYQEWTPISIREYETNRKYLEFNAILSKDKYVLIDNKKESIKDRVYDIETNTLHVYLYKILKQTRREGCSFKENEEKIVASLKEEINKRKHEPTKKAMSNWREFLKNN